MATFAKSLTSSCNSISWLDAKTDPQFLQRIEQALDGGADILRLMPHRRVIRIDAQPAVIVKHFFPEAAAGILKRVFRGDPAVREWNALQLAACRGVPVPRAIAVGRRSRFPGRESFLVAAALDGAVPLGQYLYGARRAAAALRRTAIEQAARVLRKAHDAGMFHKDLHLENLMVQNKEAGPQLFLIDLQRAAFRPSLACRARVVNLAELHGGCAEATRSERLRFLKTYLSARPAVEQDLRPFLLRLEKRALKHRLGLWRSREKRCLRENRDFMRLPSQHFVAFGRRRDWTDDLESLVGDPAGFLGRSQIVKDSRTTTVARLTLAGRRIYLKRYNYQGVGYALKDGLRAARAKRVWKAANSCVMRGVSVALPIAYMERRRFRLLRESYIVTAAVEGEPLAQLFARYRDHFRRKHVLIMELAIYVKRMHDRGVAHRDLKPDNIVAREEEGGRYRFYIVDFDGFYLGAISRRRRIKNLVRLLRELGRDRLMSRTDRLRFLSSYLGKDFQRDWKKFGRRLYGRSV